MPEFCKEDVSFPALYYLNEQFIDGIQVGVSCSIIPNIVSADELEKKLKQENAGLYCSLEEPIATNSTINLISKGGEIP